MQSGVSRPLSSSVAIVVGFVSALAFDVITSQPWAFVGIRVAAIVGAWLGPRLTIDSRLPIITALAMAGACTVGGAYAIGLAFGIYAPLFGTVGLIIYGIPVFLLLIVPAGAWAALSTFLARRGVA